MVFSNVLGLVLLFIIGLGAGVLGGGLLVYWRHRRQLVSSTKYLLDRLQLAESDVHRMREDIFVLREYLSRRGLLDEDDLNNLRRELVELPRQIEAERAELVKGVLEKDDEERLVKNIPDTLH